MRLDALARALDARKNPAVFWLRDDDAVEPTPALERLLGLGMPTTLAVIPASTGAALGVHLAGRAIPGDAPPTPFGAGDAGGGRPPNAPLSATAGVSVAVHGWAHTNHAPAGQKSQELGAHRPLTQVLAELADGLSRLRALHGPRLVPLLVPPWNRIAPGVVAGLPDLGFRALSVFGANRPGPLPEVNTQVDLIDWRGTRGGRPPALLEAEIIAAMAEGPVGILAHHLVHDAAAWNFLGALVTLTAAHPGARWVPVTSLMP